MSEQTNIVQPQNCEELQEEVVETSYVCGECFHVCATMEDFSNHCCSSVVSNEGIINPDENQYEGQFIQHNNNTDGSQTETEADMEVAVASILGEKMKQNAPQNKSVSDVHSEQNQMEDSPEQYLEPSIEHTSIVDYQTEADPVLHIVEHTDQLEPGMVVESMEIPSTNVYIYDNPFYLNRLMKDNTCGRRARHDAPYTHRLGPWDDRSSRFLIQLLKEYPKAFFIMGKNSKRTEAWEMIRYKLSESGYQFTVLQIRMRWRELCKRYRNVVNHNDLHRPNARRTCQFFEELNDLFGIWDSTATELLIKELGANGTKRLGQNGGTRMRHKAWQQISDVLAENGYEYSADQVHGRWNALVMLYRRMVNHNANQDNEPITIAFRNSIEAVFNYIPDNKIYEKCEKNITDKKKWTFSVEQSLLNTYKNLVKCFRHEEHKFKVWQQIVTHLKEEANYNTTAEKVKTRFYELTKQYAAMLQHNAEPGTLYRESRHHEILAEIYDTYNCWPHDGSVIRLDKANAIRLRQLDAQLLWTEEESNAVLQLYPNALLEHIRNNDSPQPPEELWVQLAKALYAVYRYVKAPYEIEEHIALLRQGHKSPNLFPFREAMDILEAAENSLGFSPESPSRDNEQLLPYWSHKAARLMLDLMVHYRQEGIKIMTDNLFEVICNDMEKEGFTYTAEECREYYFLLQKIFKNRMYSKKKLTENPKPFPYIDRMTELRMIASQTGNNKMDNENCSTVLTAAASQLTSLKVGEKNSRRRSVEIFLLNCKMHIRDDIQIRPPPSIKELAGLLLAAMKDETNQYLIEPDTMKKLTDAFSLYMDVLSAISEHGAMHIYHDYQAEALKTRERISDRRNLRAIGVQWTNDNSRIMLETIKEWLLLCHSSQEMEDVLGCGQPLWEEVAYKLSRRFNKCPQICWQYFIQLRKEYMAALSSSGSLKHMPSLKSVHCQKLLQYVLSLYVAHDGEWDERDARWISEAKDWSCEESLELLFTVREFWSGDEPVNWKKISLMMCAGGYKRDAKSCHSRFKELYSIYQKVFQHNQESSIRNRQRCPFYYKINSLFGYTEDIPSYQYEDVKCESIDSDVDEEELIEVLLAGMKEIKNLLCHSVPRVPLLHALAQYAESHSQGTWPSLNIYQIWKYLVQVHQAQRESMQQGLEGPLGVDLDGLWQDAPSPAVAFGLLSIPYPKWEMVSDWSLEELTILVDTIVRWEGTSDSYQVDEYLAVETSQHLQMQGYVKTSVQCKEQWEHMVATYSHGGYQCFKKQINLVYLFQPVMVCSNIFGSICKAEDVTEVREKVEVCDIGYEKNENSKKKEHQLSHASLPSFDHKNYSLTNCGKDSKNITKRTEVNSLQREQENICLSDEEPKEAYKKHETNFSKDARIKARVIRVDEVPDSKIVVCEVQKGDTVQILKIHYSLGQNIPSNIRFMHIPRHLVFPEHKQGTRKFEICSPNTDNDEMDSFNRKPKDNRKQYQKLEANPESSHGLVLSGDERGTLPKKIKLLESVGNEKHNTKINDEGIDPCTFSIKSLEYSSSKGREVMKNSQETQGFMQLAAAYHKQCGHESDRFESLIKESQEETMSDYQNVMSAVQELSELL